MLKSLQLESINEGNLQDLVSGEVPESEVLEYKEALPGYDRAQTIDFLADVSSFANAGGGDIVYGIRERERLPESVSGLQGITFDTERNRLEHKILSGIEPRIHGIRFQPVPLGVGGLAFVVRIPRSWAAPHVVKYQDHWKFYRRVSGGKVQMDLSDLRAAFDLAGTTAERIRNFRAERIGNIMARDTPVALAGAGVLALHLVPLSAFDARVRYDVAALPAGELHDGLRLFGAVANNHRYNFDGVVLFLGDPSTSKAYVQLFRNGCIEAATTGVMYQDRNPPLIASGSLERELKTGVAQYLRFQHRLGVDPPVLIMITLTGVRGCIMALPNGAHSEAPTAGIDRGTVIVPEALVEAFDCDVAGLLRPALQVIWNAAGHPQSPYAP